MASDLIHIMQTSMEHHFDIMSIHMPHYFIKEGLKNLSTKNSDILLKDFKLWIAEKVKDMDPHDADEMFGVPLVPFYDYEIPRNAPSWETEVDVRLNTFGCNLAGWLIKMVYQRFEKEDVDYFRRYHRVVCIRSCSSPRECSKIRQLVVERDILETELAKLKHQHNTPMELMMPDEEFDDDNELELDYDENAFHDEGIDGVEPVEDPVEPEVEPDVEVISSDEEDEPLENSPKRFKA